MWDATDDFLTKNNSVWSSNVGFSKHVTKFRGTKTKFDAAAQKQAKPITGITDDKNKAKGIAIDAAVLLAGNVRAYASEKGNATLAEKMNYSKRKLSRLGEPTLKVVLEGIYNEASALTDATDYNVNATTTGDFNTKVTNYINAAPKGKTAKSEKKTATENLDVFIHDGDAVLVLMDGMIGNFAAVNADFVSGYHNVRNIDNYGVGKKPKPEEPK